jgi:TorA maturation chaperone TorD
MAALAVAAVTEPVSREDGGEALRANTYSLLAAMLAATPTAALLGLLSEIEEPAEAQTEGLARAWQVLRLAGQCATPEALADEYQQLFIGLGRGEVVPYCSWYMTGFLMDQPLAVLRQDLQRLGFARQEGVKEPEDHAAALCETMSLLVAGAANLESQRAFFAAHVGSWLDTFFRDLQQAPSARFYRSVGQLGEQFLAFEKHYLTLPE